MNRAPPVPRNCHIRVVALSAPDAVEFPERYRRALNWLQKSGYQISEGETTTTSTGHMAGSPELRANDLLDAWFDPDVDVILSVIGGQVTAQILDDLPYQEMAKKPKLLIGYSDTTALLVALWTHARIVSLCGPALMPQFGEADGPLDYTRIQFEQAIHHGAGGEIPESEYCIEEHLAWGLEDSRARTKVYRRTRRSILPGIASGPVIAANLGTLLSLAGTSHFPSLAGTILLLEDDECESPDSVDRYFTQLRQSGVLSDISALVIGRFPRATGISDSILDDIILRALRGRSIPVVAGFEFGHVDPIATIAVGPRAQLSALTEEKIQLIYTEDFCALPPAIRTEKI